MEIKLRNGGSSKVQVTQEHPHPHPHPQVHPEYPRTQMGKRSRCRRRERRDGAA